MGVVLPLLPKKIELGELGKFSNAVTPWGSASSSSSALYREAAANYNKALASFRTATNAANNAKGALDELDSYFQPLRRFIDEDNWHPLFRKILGEEGYGDPNGYPDRYNNSTYKKFIPAVSLKNKTAATNALSLPDWEYIYNAGLITKYPGLISAQKSIVNWWKDEMDKERDARKKKYDVLSSDVLEKQKDVEDAKKKLDDALKAEGIASDQRVREAMTDPEYIQAQAAAQQAILNAQTRQKTRTMLFAVVGLAILVGGAALIFKNR